MILKAEGTLPAFATAGLVAGDGVAGPTQREVLRMGFETSLDSPQGVGALAMARMVRDLSGNRLEIGIFPDAQLGPAAKMLDMIRKGDLDLFLSGTGIFSSLEKRLNVFDIPYLFDSAEQAHPVLDGKVGLAMLEALDPHGLKGLSFWETGMRDITCNVRPIRKADDLAGLRMRIPVNNPAQVALWKQLGTEPVPLPFGQIYDALKTGRADAQEHPVSLIYSGAFFEVQRYLSLTGHMYTPMVQVMNLRRFNDLPENDREILVRASRAGAAAQRTFAKENGAGFLEKMKARGIQVNTLSRDDRLDIRNRVRPVMEELYARDNGDAWLRAIQDAHGAK